MTSPPLSRPAAIASWSAQIVVAVILGQSLFFKFTGAPEARALFEQLGAEPWGRLATGVLELVTVILVLVPRTAAVGAALAVGTMAGAVLSHLFVLGVEVAGPAGEGDGGLLFGLALATLAAALVVLVLRRAELPLVGPRLRGRPAA